MSLLFPIAETTRTITKTDTVVVREAAGDDDTGWTALGGARRDLWDHQIRRAQEISAHMYRANPLVWRTIRIYSSFIAGDGFSVGAANPEVQAVIDENWSSPRSDLEENHVNFARWWLIFGEGVHPMTADAAGNTTMGWIDPVSIADVHVDPRNQLLFQALDVRLEAGGRDRLDIIRHVTDPTDPEAGLWAGDTFYWLFDRLGGSRRGTPFLLPSLDWFEIFDSTLWEMYERRKAMRAHMWSVAVDGDPTEVDELEKKWGTAPPKSGSTRFHTANVKVSAESPQLGQYEDVASSRFMQRLLATGAGVAPHWLGDPDDTNRSTAESMDIPVLRGLVDVQSQWQRNIGKAAQYMVDRKVAAGMLPRIVQRHDEAGNPIEGREGMVAARDLVEVSVPEIEEKKVAKAAESLAAVANAFLTVDSLGIVGREAMAKIMRNLLPSLGVPLDQLPDIESETGVEQMEAFLESAARGL